VFHKEGINQYLGIMDNLKEDVLKARSVVDEGARGLETSALEGEVVANLALDPIAERYLVLRLQERVETEWVPRAQQEAEAARAQGIDNPKVRERLETELYELLQEAATERRIFRRDQRFLEARDEAQEYYRKVASGTRKAFDATVRLRQLRSLLDYLRGRSRQYARLATRMDSLVQDMERDAERLRRGDRSVEPGYTLRVEIFETLEEPRERVWHRVYDALYIEGGRYLSTFDRKTLAETITRELEAEVRPDGSVQAKPVDRTVEDLRWAWPTKGSGPRVGDHRGSRFRSFALRSSSVMPRGVRTA
jgi:hypothetical protein